MKVNKAELILKNCQFLSSPNDYVKKRGFW